MSFRNLFERPPFKKAPEKELLPTEENQEEVQPEKEPLVSKEKAAQILTGVATIASVLGSLNVKAENPKKIDKQTPQTELSAENLSNKKLEAATTYQAKAADFNKFENAKANEGGLTNGGVEKEKMNNGQELVRINFKINFAVDKADIPKDNTAEIAKQFSEFLDNITPENYQQFADADLVFFSACSEEKTNRWGEKGNEALADKRGENGAAILDKVLASQPLAKLNPEQRAVMKNKKIGVEIASTHAQELGVIKITDKVNPETGKNYTDQEVQKLKEANPQEYQKLLEANRVAYFKAEIVNEKIENNLVKLFSKYDRAVLDIDDSPSMRDDEWSMVSDLKNNYSQLKNTKIFIANSSDKFQGMKKFDSRNIETNLNQKYDGSGAERKMATLRELLSNIPLEAGKTIVTSHTDELYQNFTLSELEDIAGMVKSFNNQAAGPKMGKHTLDVVFVRHLQDGKKMMMSLNEVVTKVEKLVKDKEKLEKGKVNYSNRDANPKTINWDPVDNKLY